MTSSLTPSSDSTMDTLSLTLTNTRVIDGLIFAANSAGMTPEAFAESVLTSEGQRFADGARIGIITGAAFIARFTPTEYGNILAASVPPVDATPEQEANAAAVAGLIAELTASSDVALDNPQVETGLTLLVSLGLLDAARPAEILSYDRPTPQV